MFFKAIQYGYETFQKIIQINTSAVEGRGGSYKLMFSLETATFYFKKILQRII